MKETNKLSQAGRSSLQNWSQGIPFEKADKNVLLSFKAGSALNKQLMKEHPKQVKTISATKQLIQQAREAKQYQRLHAISQQQKLMSQVKNLSDFKPAVTRQKTKLMVQRIISDKRDQHLKCLNDFRQQTQDNLNLAKQIQQTTKQIKQQFFDSNRDQFQNLTNSLTDEVLLQRDRTVLTEIIDFIQKNQQKRKDGLGNARESLLSLYNDLKQKFKGFAVELKQQFRDIAFVLQDQSTSICSQQLQKVIALCDKSIQQVNTFLDNLIIHNQEQFIRLKSALQQKIQRWKIVNKQDSIQKFITKVTDPLFVKTPQRTALFSQLKQVQQKVHTQRQQLIKQLFSTNILSKQIVDKWLDTIKNKSEQANNNIDILFNKLLAEVASNKTRGLKQLENLKQRLIYIGADSQQIIVQELNEKCQPLIVQNEEGQKQLLSKGIQYIEKYESLENDMCQNMGKWMGALGVKNDELKKKMEMDKQSYQIQKAKILDDDEEKIDRLNEELQGYKKELKQSLHHPKLQELQQKCFEKVEELEQHYRTVYDSNKELISKHPEKITEFYDMVEREIVAMFSMVDQTRKEEFIAKVRANNQKLAMRQIEKQDVIKSEEAAKLREEQTKKKGGKAPPQPKPKDPKKLAAEIEQRKQTILKSMGDPVIKQINFNGKNWIVEKQIIEICKQWYPGYNPDIQNPPDVDLVQQPILDKVGENIVSKDVIVSLSLLQQQLQQYRDKMFQDTIQSRKNISQKQAQQDKKYLAESLQILDDRLKAHYPMKSIIQTEIIGKRSTQINSHKKRYERHARSTRQKVDEQTQKFNYLMEKSLEITKTYNEQRKAIKEELANVKNIANFQTISRKSRQSNDALDNGMRQVLKQLKKLSGSELDNLITKNDDFLKQITNNTQYAKEELEWYNNMMNQISIQLKQQKQKRSQKVNEIEAHMKKKKQQLMQAFQKDYAVGMDDMAAKDCAGSKYGKPKMIAQEKLRMEMSKCQKAQQNINNLMKQLQQKLQQPMNSNQLLVLRQLLMTIGTCVRKYSKHIEALKPETKVPQMPRVNYVLSRPDTALMASQKDEDSKKLLKQLSALGPLSQQKDDKKYNICVVDINRIVKQQVAKIYIGDKAKFLNAQKIPDNLQQYLATIKKNAQIFRLNSIRQLRQSCNLLSDLTKRISQRMLGSIKQTACKSQQQLSKQFSSTIQHKKSQNDTIKSQHSKKLSPNLANPASRKQLDELNNKQNLRAPQYLNFIHQSKTKTYLNLFQNSSQFLNSLLNNFEFLILFYDSLYLLEDFIQLPGDETNQKKHLNLKQLILMKQKKTKIDTTSERNINKKWEGLKFDVFDIEGNKFIYTKTEVQQPKDIKKAPPKKQTKDPKKEIVPVQQIKVSKQIQSLKTFRQKSAFTQRNYAYESFLKAYNQQINKFKQLFSNIEDQQLVFSNKWKETVDRLKKASQ